MERQSILSLSISAAAGACLTSIVVSPFEVAKVRLQTQGFRLNGNTTNPSVGRGIWPTLTGIVHNEGLSSLWRGIRPTLLLNIPSSALYFTLYEHTKYLIQQKSSGVVHETAPLIAGALSRSSIVTMMLPLELVRTNLQYSQEKSTKGAYELLVKVGSKCGIRSLWTGLGITIARDAPFSAIYWYGYESFKKLYVHILSDPTHRHIVHFFAAASSGAIAAIITNPADVIKTRIQVVVGNCGSLEKSTSAGQVTRDIIAKSGFRGFFAGLNARLVRIPISCAIMMSTYEFSKVFLPKKLGI